MVAAVMSSVFSYCLWADVLGHGMQDRLSALTAVQQWQIMAVAASGWQESHLG
jgi:hypothetical protein